MSGAGSAEGGASGLLDAHGRSHTYLRVSVTDRCNYRCTYCMPEEGLDWKPREHLLSFEEIARLVGVFARLGVRRVRLTGGEPLVRKGLHHLVRMLSALELDDLAMTTNGHLLPREAERLAAAGLRRVNVSCDAITPEVFRTMTRNGDVSAVLAGIDAARAAGLTPIKVNAVVLRDVNVGEVVPLIEHFAPHAADTELRFIEFMPFSEPVRRHAPGASLRERIGERYTLRRLGPGPGGPAVDWQIVETGQRIGFISPITEHFCARCNRLRLDADGHLRTCLSRDPAPSLREVMRSGVSDAGLEQVIRDLVWAKVEGHEAHLDAWRPFDGVMTSIGG